jgi:hypothetical protein
VLLEQDPQRGGNDAGEDEAVGAVEEGGVKEMAGGGWGRKWDNEGLSGGRGYKRRGLLALKVLRWLKGFGDRRG